MISTGFRPRQRRTYKNCGPSVSTRGPLFNVGESDKAYHIELAVPGWNKEHISIEAEQGHLVIQGKSEASSSSDITYRRMMFGPKDFNKSFIIPDDVDVEKISASFENGVLNITLNKDEEKIRNKSITIS
ncbi:MAG: Hsp20/alpha crystallin family protein [Saprospiraceae bacterium]|nr:Hsp20/alpha crystallin family protein [Saprospiraceae bacterium]